MLFKFYCFLFISRDYLGENIFIKKAQGKSLELKGKNVLNLINKIYFPRIRIDQR